MKLKPLLWNDVIHSWWYELDGTFLVYMIIYTHIYQNLTHKKKLKEKED